jgi:hypothetical protein
VNTSACVARRFGGAPTYALTEGEKTVTLTHVANIPVRNPGIVRVGRYYGITFATCVPADPASKGGSEATVRLAKADLVPTWANLRPVYASFDELERACASFCREVNARPHRETRRPPEEMLASERAHLHPVLEVPWYEPGSSSLQEPTSFRLCQRLPTLRSPQLSE